MRYCFIKIFVLLILILSVSGCLDGYKPVSVGFERKLLCDAETIDDSKYNFTEVNQHEQLFANVETRTRDDAHSGTFSLKLTPQTPYGFTTTLENVGPDEYICVTAWRKSSDNNGVIVIDGGEGVYHAGKFLVDEDKDGWQKIYLEIYTPPNFFKGEVKIFVWNNSQETVYFDDLQIVHRNKKSYPEYHQNDVISMYIDEADFAKLEQKRMTAYKTSVLVSDEDDYSNLVFFDGNEFLNAKYRLKGDLLDHLQGDKWSFRIKLKNGFAWKHLRTFSVQNPLTRNFVYEWLAHKIFDQEDVLSTRYGFVPLRLNNHSLGIYAWEEHFEKQLVESRNRREGPILRFDESIFWQRVLESNQTGESWDIDYFNAAPIIPFKEGQILSDSLKVKQMIEGQKLILQYKNRKLPVSEIFDIDKLAKYYSLVDLTQAYHGFTWHNQRFYYNPVTCLLEPIAFDGYIEGGIYKRFDEPVSGMVAPFKIKDFSKEELMLFQPFSDSLFNRKYLECLQNYSAPEFVDALIRTYSHETDSISGTIRKEFPYYSFDFGYIKDQACWIRENLDAIGENMEKLGIEVGKVNPQKFAKQYTSNTNDGLIPMMVHAYYDKEKQKISVLSYHNNRIKLLGVFLKDQLPESFNPEPELEPYNGLQASKATADVSGVPVKLLFSVNNVMYETPVFSWQYSDTLTARQQTLLKQTEGLNIEDGCVVFAGDYTFTSDVVIPKTVREVIFRAGTKIDLREGAGFFSFVPVVINGTSETPVIITSSDHSANGFNVIQPGGRSLLQHVKFSRLSNLKKDGWMTPAAITFYEADLDAEYCVFASNYNCDDALNVVRSDFQVENSKFENTFADAFDSDFCTGKVNNCSFSNTGNDAIDFSGSRILITGCEMTNVSDKAVSGGEHSYLTVNNCRISGAHIGVASKDQSELKLSQISMDKTEYGLLAFVKKPEYGPARITIDDLKMKDVVVSYQIEEGSFLRLNGKIVEGREKKLAQKLYQ